MASIEQRRFLINVNSSNYRAGSEHLGLVEKFLRNVHLASLSDRCVDDEARFGECSCSVLLLRVIAAAQQNRMLIDQTLVLTGILEALCFEMCAIKRVKNFVWRALKPSINQLFSKSTIEKWSLLI